MHTLANRIQFQLSSGVANLVSPSGPQIIVQLVCKCTIGAFSLRLLLSWICSRHKKKWEKCFSLFSAFKQLTDSSFPCFVNSVHLIQLCCKSPWILCVLWLAKAFTESTQINICSHTLLRMLLLFQLFLGATWWQGYDLRHASLGNFVPMQVV